MKKTPFLKSWIQKTFFFSRRILRLNVAFVIVLATSTFWHSNLFAKLVPPPGTGTYSCGLLGTSIHHPFGPTLSDNPNGPWIYDDGHSNYFDGSAGSWNCGREFIFAEYTNQNISFDFAYGGEYADGYGHLSPPVSSHTIKLYNNVTNVLINTWPYYPDVMYGADNLLVLSTPWNTTPGEYRIEYWRDDESSPHPKVYPDIVGIFVLQPPLQKVWIDAPPICSDFSGNYNFQVHAYPDFSSLIQYSGAYYLAPTCDGDNPLAESWLSFDFSASSIPAVKHHPWPMPGGVLNTLFGYQWIPSYPDVNDFWIDASDISDYLPPSGWAYGMGLAGPMITVTFTDGITTMTATKQITIEESVSDVLVHPGVPATTPYYFAPLNVPTVSYPTGTPNPSFNFYDYTITGPETWTPTNNPVTRLNGGGSVSTINIEDNITIKPGANFVIGTGLTLQMGPGATITVDQASVPSGTGGILGMVGSTVTAYRGCSVSESGSDHSTWSGVTLLGDPTWSEGSSWMSPCPESKMYMTNSTISYADVAVQNGAGPGSSGGDFYTAGGGNNFHNNKEHIKLWPYHNIVGGVDIGAIIDIYGCTFNNDNNVWFSSPDFISANDIKGVAVHSCILTNNTDNTIYAGINGYQAGLIVNGSRFDNFYYGIQAWFAAATQGVSICNSTFNNNHMGIVDYADIAPVITGNILNIPAYSGPPASPYPGTAVEEVDDQNVGITMSYTTGYNLYDNTFQTSGAPAPYYYYPYTTGTLEYNTGGDDNIVTGNTFTGVGVAMLSNFVNNSSSGGLLYQCNTDTHIGFDIAVLGNNTADGGINQVQYTGGGYPAGNSFSIQWNIWNQQKPLVYLYSTLYPSQDPINIYGTVYLPSLPVDPACYDPGIITGRRAAVSANAGGNSVVVPSSSKSNIDYVNVVKKVNYYMTDSNGVNHRDSLYYWAGQMNTPYGDLLLANLYVEDNLIDNANTVYDNIIARYNLDPSSAEGNDFAQGRKLMDILIAKRVNNEPLLKLSASQVATLKSVKANATMWAHGRAEGWLNACNEEAINDPLLYPYALPLSNSTDNGKNTSPSEQSSKTLTNMALTNQVYPNPVKDVLQVMYTAQSTDPITIQIEDISGRMVITEHLQTGKHAEIDVSKLVPGMYLYRIQEGTRTTMTGKVAKE